MSAKRKSPREIDYHDVDDIIGVAAELSDLDQERLSVDDLTDIARDLDIPAEFVAPAVAELARRRKAQLEEDARKKKTRTRIMIAAGVAVALVVIWALVGNAKLHALSSEVAARRAQVKLVVERRAEIERIWGSAPHSLEKQAEMSGAENRVRVEQGRYNEAVAAYNQAAGAFPGSLWAAIFGHDYPLAPLAELKDL